MLFSHDGALIIHLRESNFLLVRALDSTKSRDPGFEALLDWPHVVSLNNHQLPTVLVNTQEVLALSQHD